VLTSHIDTSRIQFYELGKLEISQMEQSWAKEKQSLARKREGMVAAVQRAKIDAQRQTNETALASAKLNVTRLEKDLSAFDVDCNLRKRDVEAELRSLTASIDSEASRLRALVASLSNSYQIPGSSLADGFFEVLTYSVSGVPNGGRDREIAKEVDRLLGNTAQPKTPQKPSRDIDQEVDRLLRR
jgi:hypothetical protein